MMSVLMRTGGLAHAGLRLMRHATPSICCVHQIRMYSSNEVIKWSKQEVDPLMEMIKQSPSPEQLLGTVQRHLPSLSMPHTMQVLQTLFKLSKQNDRSERTVASIIKSPVFASLCQTLRRHAGALAPHELVGALKALGYLRVPADTLIFQTLLQLVRDNVNGFNVRQIMFLEFLLSKYDKPNHLMDALNLALPLAFQVQLQLEMDTDDFPLLRDMLVYACYRRLPERCLNNIATALVLHEGAGAGAMDAESARAIATALCQVECGGGQAGRARLLHASLEALAVHVSRRALPFPAVWQLLRRLAARVQAGPATTTAPYYHEPLMDSIADFVVSEHMDLDTSIKVAAIFNKINHLSRPLAEHLASVALEAGGEVEAEVGAGGGTQLEGARALQVVQLVRYLSNVGAPSPPPAALQRALAARARHYLARPDCGVLWPRFALELGTLGVYEPRVLRALCDPAWLDVHLQPDAALDHLQLLLLVESVRTFRPELAAAVQLPPAVAARARQLYPVRATHAALHAALLDALGSPSVLLPNLTLPSGLVIDYAIFVKDGAPLELEYSASGKNYLSDLRVPPDAAVVCVVVVGGRSYSASGAQLRGKERLVVQLAAAQAGPALPLAPHHLLPLPPAQRAPLLRRDLLYLAHSNGIALSLPVATGATSTNSTHDQPRSVPDMAHSTHDQPSSDPDMAHSSSAEPRSTPDEPDSTHKDMAPSPHEEPTHWRQGT